MGVGFCSTFGGDDSCFEGSVTTVDAAVFAAEESSSSVFAWFSCSVETAYSLSSPYKSKIQADFSYPAQLLSKTTHTTVEVSVKVRHGQS